jgi:hypothetical protein
VRCRAGAFLEPCSQAIEAQQRHPCRRQLEGQGHAVQAPADVEHRVHVVAVELKAAVNGANPLLEELHGAGSAGLLRRERRGGWRQGECTEPINLLIGQPQRFVAGHQQVQLRRRAQQCGGELGNRGQHRFAVVEHDQAPTVPQPFGQCSRRLCPRRHQKAGRNGQRQMFAIAQRGQVHQTDACGKLAFHRMCQRVRQGALADAARADQAHRAVHRDQRAQRQQTVVAAEQRRRWRQRAGLDAGNGLMLRRQVTRRRRHEAVALARYRGNDRRPEQLAQCPDVDLKVVVFDHPARPHDFEQFVLAHRTVPPFDQRKQHVERAHAQPHRLAVDAQLPFGGADLDGAELLGCGLRLLHDRPDGSSPTSASI